MYVGGLMVEVSNICKSYGKKVILNGVSLSALPGEQIALVGRNGCGKSTLMQIMAGEQFVYDACMLDGQLQYFLPANRCVFPRLTEQAPLYDHLYCLLNYKENGLLRYGKRYYKDFNRQEDVLLQFLWEISGWKSGKV